VVLMAAVLLFIVVFCYALEPHWDPRRPHRLSFFSFATCAWVFPVIRAPHDPPITEGDFPHSPGTQTYNTEQFVARFESQWTPRSRTSLIRAVIRLILPAWGSVHVVKGLDRMLQFVDAYVLACIIAFIEGNHGTVVGAKLMVVAILQRTISDVAHHNSWWPMNNGRAQITIPMQILCIRKLRRLSPEGVAMTSLAEIQQMMLDIGDQMEVGLGLPGPKFILIDLLRCSIVVWQLSKFYGVAAFTTGLVTSAMLLYGQSFCASAAQDAADTSRTWNKRRLELLHEICQALLPLKVYGWAPRYLDPLTEAATNMVQAARKQAAWNALGTLLGGAVGDVFCVVALFVSVFSSGGRPDIQTFVMAQVFTSILQTSIDDIRAAYRGVLLLHRVLARVEGFLRLPERSSDLPEGPLSISAGSFSWATVPGGHDMLQTFLSRISLQAKDGELVIVSGPVGAGKTCLLMSLLGETRCVSGTLSHPGGPIAFQPQVPYLLEGSIRDNVLFGMSAHSEKEQRLLELALSASQLSIDMDNAASTLHHRREHTQVGRKGSELSGGQRARTTLARAVYATLSGAELVLLDDPVASIDNELVEGAWKAAVLEAMGGATRIIVVNAQLLERLGPSADRVVILDAGSVVFNGRPADLKTQSELLERLGAGYEIRAARPASAAVTPAAAAALALPSVPKATVPAEERLSPSNLRQRHVSLLAPSDVSKQRNQVVPRTNGQCDKHSGTGVHDMNGSRLAVTLKGVTGLVGLVHATLFAGHGTETKETRPSLISRGVVGCKSNGTKKCFSLGDSACQNAPRKSDFSVCMMFFRRQRLWVLGATFCTFFAEIAPPLAIQVLQYWEGGKSGLNDLTAFSAFTSLALGGILLNSLSHLLQGMGLASSSMSLRGDIDQRLICISMSYFWCGGKVEDVLAAVTVDPMSFGAVSTMAAMVSQNIVGLVAVVYSMPALLPVVTLASVLFRYTNAPKSWGFKQLLPLSQRRASVLMHMAAEEFESRVAIKALGRQQQFDEMVQKAAMKGFYIERTFIAARNLASHFNMLVDFVFAACALGIVMRTKTVGGDAAQAVVLYKLVLGLSNKIQVLQRTSDTAADSVGKYRVVEGFVSTEHVEATGGNKSPASWPSKGHILFHNVSFRYAPNAPLALRQFSAVIHGGENIGVVGPPGSGKSTLLNLLFRLVPCSEGVVSIDSIDIATLSLSSLRAALGVVPQEPVIFHGSLKANLGGNSVTDADVLTALATCGLQKLVNVATLEKELTASELSLGEMQLLAAARALLRRPKILILDEATAALDKDSAERLLGVISHQARSATVLSIAHRLSFVLQSDRIMVLGSGALEAFGTLEELQHDPESYFCRQLRAEQGDGAALH